MSSSLHVLRNAVITIAILFLIAILTAGCNDRATVSAPKPAKVRHA